MRPRPAAAGWQFLPGRARVVYQPLGVVGIIGAWNYPLLLSLSPLVSALAAGNHVMLKPSELAPRTADLMARLISDLFPADYVTVVTGGPETGAAFAALPFDHLLFTGSTRVGKLIMRSASENLTPVTLELGGKSPALVHPDFPAQTAAARIMAGKLYNAGQTCIAPDYVLVEAGARDEFVRLACGSRHHDVSAAGGQSGLHAHRQSRALSTAAGPGSGCRVQGRRRCWRSIRRTNPPTNRTACFRLRYCGT